MILYGCCWFGNLFGCSGYVIQKMGVSVKITDSNGNFYADDVEKMCYYKKEMVCMKPRICGNCYN